MRQAYTLLFLPICFCLSLEMTAQCGLPEALPISDLGTRFDYFRVNGIANDDLSSSTQGICGINIRFRHATVGDVRLRLSSPDGSQYFLIMPSGSQNTSGTLWDIRFVPCTQSANPDQGSLIKPVWDSDQMWGQNQTYTGTYHAETCLDQINSGPVNGIWTVTVQDMTGQGAGQIEEFSIDFCDPAGISCDDCQPSGGIISLDTILACGGNPSLANISVSPTYNGTRPDPSSYSYYFAVISDGIIRDITMNPDLSSAPQGEYVIRGINVDNRDVSELLTYIGRGFGVLVNALNITRPLFCAGLSNGSVRYQILSDPVPIYQDTAYICAESPIVFGGDSIFTAGTYTKNFITNTGCDSMVELRVLEFRALTPIMDQGIISCGNKPYNLSWTNTQFETEPRYNWYSIDGSVIGGQNQSSAQIDLPGTYFLSLRLGGCADTVSINVSGDGSLPTLDIRDVVMDCDNNVGQLRPISNANTFSWTGPFGFSSTDQDIDVTEPGAYTITAIGTNCGVRKTVHVSADFTQPQEIQVQGGTIRCQNDTVQISAMSSSPDVTYSWTGPGAFTSTLQSPQVTQEGVYQVEVSHAASGCSVTRNVEVVSIFDEPSIAITGTTLDCQGLSKRITTNVSDDFALFSWNGPDGYTSTERNPLVSAPGMYDVTITDAQSCQYEASATVTVDTVAPTVSASDIILGCFDSTFQLNAIFTSLHPPDFVWTGPNNYVQRIENPIGTQIGTYTITVRDPVNSCFARTSIDVRTDGSKPEIISTENGVINCAQSQDTIRVNTSCTTCTFIWSGPSGPEVSTGDSLIVTQPGMYDVEVVDLSTGCVSGGLFNVANRTTPVTPDVAVTNIGCTTDGVLLLRNNTAFPSFEWVDSLTGNIQMASRITRTSPGTIYLNSRDRNGCLDTLSFSVRVRDDAPDFTIITDTINCAKSEVGARVSINNYTVGQVATYDWTFTDGQKSTDPLPRLSDTGVVSVSIVMRNGCTGSAVANVQSDFSTPQLTAIGGGFRCSDPGLMMSLNTPREPLLTLWSGPNGFSSTNRNPLVSEPGVYYLDILGANGCPARDSATAMLTDPLPVLSTLNDTITCADSIAELTFMTDADLSTSSFFWLDPGGRINNNDTIRTTLVGPYLLELIDSNMCRTVQNVTVAIDTVSFGHTVTSQMISCIDSLTPLTLDTVYDFLTYSWYHDSMLYSTEVEPIADQGGLFQLVTTNTNGCTRQINHVVLADTASPPINLAPSTLDCSQNRITLRPAPVDVTWTYEWTGPSGFSSTMRTPLITEAGVYTVRTLATNGCISTTRVLIDEDFRDPDILLDDTFIPCNGDSVQLGFATMDSLAEVNWFGPDGFYVQQDSATTLMPGTYYVVTKGFNGCQITDSILVSADPLLDSVLLSIQNIDCTHDTASISILNAQADFQYNWEDAQSNVLPDTSSVTSLQANRYILRAVHQPSSCVIVDTISLIADTILPSVTILEMDSIVCQHREILLGSDTDTLLNFLWSTSDGRILGNDRLAQVRVDSVGLYRLDVFNPVNECMNFDTIQVVERQNNLQGVFTSQTDANCNGDDDAIVLVDSVSGGSGPYQFALGGNFFTDRGGFNFVAPGTYTLTVSDVNGCLYDTTLTIERAPRFDLNLGDDLLIKLGDSVELDAVTSLSPDQIIDYLWFLPDSMSCPDCNTQNVSPFFNTRYIVSVTSESGCTESDEVLVRVEDKGGIFIPNAFTPNGDGQNDEARIYTSNSIDFVASLEIFDRWGNSVYAHFNFDPRTTQPGWDGTFEGSELNPGVFVVQVVAQNLRGELERKVGSITLIR